MYLCCKDNEILKILTNTLYLLLQTAAASPAKNMDRMFKRIANELLNFQVLTAGSTDYRLTEIEFYFYHPLLHPDTYSHYVQYPRSVATKQSVIGGWYFHRFKHIDTYTHTRRGVDITFGNAMSGTYGGILIRGIRRLHDDMMIAGPSTVVKELLMAMNDPAQFSKQALATYGGAALDPENILHLSPSASHLKPISRTMRFGLGNKNPAFRNKLYRYYTGDASIKS